MSKFPIEDRLTQTSALLPAAASTEEVRPNGVMRSISGFFRWYRDAVLKPETEAEKADWQKNSF